MNTENTDKGIICGRRMKQRNKNKIFHQKMFILFDFESNQYISFPEERRKFFKNMFHCCQVREKK